MHDASTANRLSLELRRKGVSITLPCHPLCIRGVSFSAGGRRIINALDLDLPDDRLTVLMGPNGAGKSVLLRLMHGLLLQDEGAILWNGKPLDGKARRKQAMVFQKPVLLRRTVAANMRFSLGLRGFARARNHILPLLARLNLDHLADQPARLLSGGEQQRLALARALALQPEVLLLDEPCANLDPASVLLIEDAIRAARTTGTKIILVTHDTHQAHRLAERVIFLHHGTISEITDAAQFFASPTSEEAKAYLDGRILV